MTKKKSEVMGVNVPGAIADKVKNDAEKSHRTVSSVIRIIIENYYRQKEVLSEVEI